MPQHRTQLFIDPDQYRAVAKLSAVQQRPISEIVREFIDLGLEQLRRHRQERLKALEELNAMRLAIKARSGVEWVEPVAEARAARQRQMEAVLSQAGQ